MKKIILCMVLFILTMQTFSQSETQAISKEYYLKKSKSQKTVAWILAGTGTALLVIVNFAGRKSADDLSFDEAATAGGLIIAGAVLDLGSIPLFIISAKNKRKAAEVSFINQPLLVPQQNVVAYKMQPGLCLKIHL